MPCPNCHQEHDTTDCPSGSFVTPPYGGRDYQPPMTNQGWECPKCHAVMAPFQPSCIHCHPIVL